MEIHRAIFRGNVREIYGGIHMQESLEQFMQHRVNDSPAIFITILKAIAEQNPGRLLEEIPVQISEGGFI